MIGLFQFFWRHLFWKGVGLIIFPVWFHIVGTESFAAKNLVAKQRASCYVAIGKLGAKIPSLVNKDMTVVQVWPLTNLFSVCIFVNNQSRSIHPSSRKAPHLPCPALFELPQRQGTQAHHVALLPDFHRRKDTVRCDMVSPKVSGQRSKQLTQT